MNGVKPWQIVVLIAAVLVVAASTFYSCSRDSGEVKQATDATMVDIATGELFIAAYPQKALVHYPAKNPTTGTETLFRVFKVESKWVLDTRNMSAIRSNKSLKSDLIVDMKSGEIRATNEKPTRADIFGK